MTRRRPSEEDLCAGCGHPRWKHAGGTTNEEFHHGTTACHHWPDVNGHRVRCTCQRFLEPARRKKGAGRTPDGRVEAQPR